jgi:hypothetical protein
VKRIAAILLLLIYTSATMGATIHLHYCMNDFVGWSLWHSANSKCGKCGMKEKKGSCCKDEHKEIKLKTEHQKSAAVDFINIFSTPALAIPFANCSFKLLQHKKFTYANFHPPPGIQNKRLYVLYGVFLI